MPACYCTGACRTTGVCPATGRGERSKLWRSDIPSSIKKIADLPYTPQCTHPEHEPPKHIVLPPGVYEHTCPRCGNKNVFVVNRASW